MKCVSQAFTPLPVDHGVVLMLRINVHVTADPERVTFHGDQIKRQSHRQIGADG